VDNNYSVMAIKKAAFVDELNNVLKVKSPDLTEIIAYLEARIKELDNAMKIK